jgi:phage anti-repressor protein
MKKKSDGMSPDMFHDATSSTPISVFTTNEETKNESKNLLQNATDGNSIKNELIKVDFDKQTVSARALYAFFELEERFSKWFKRMISYGLVENVDFTAVSFVICHKQPNDFTNIPFAPPVPFGTGGVPNGTGGVPLFTDVNNGVYQDIGDYSLTIEAAKHIAMVQRNEKGKQARQYFIDVEKLYFKTLSNKPTEVRSISLLDKFLNLLVELEGELGKQNVNILLAEKTVALEKQLAEQAALSIFKDEYLERTISKKIDMALKASFREGDQITGRNENVNRLPHLTNPKSVVALNQLEKDLQKTTLEEDLVLKYYRPSHRKTDHSLFLTATDITARLESFSKRVTVRNVGMALKKFGFERVPHSQKGGKMKGYFVTQLF